MMYLKQTVAIGVLSLPLAGCQPSELPPDLVKTQREALNKAKSVEGQLQQAQDKQKAAEAAQN